MKKNDTVLRHWHMLREIPRFPRQVSTCDLRDRLTAAGFDATLRTVQRDLVKLSSFMPLLADDSKPQGWSWSADAPQIELPSLEPHAALVFHLCEKYLESLLPVSTLDYLSPWFRAATGVLDNHGNGLSTWRKKVRVLAPGQPVAPPAIDREVQNTVTQALFLDRRILASYRPRGSLEDKHYEASPLALVVRDRVVYLVCTLRDYSDVKQLVLNRMSSAQLLDRPVEPLDGFDLDEYIARGEFGIALNDDKTIALVMNIDRAVSTGVVERPLSSDQVIEDMSEQVVRLTATVQNTAEFRRWLLGFGAYADVVSPESLRIEMKSLINQMAQRYSM